MELLEVPLHILYLAEEPVSLIRLNQPNMKHRTKLIVRGLKGTDLESNGSKNGGGGNAKALKLSELI